LRSVASHAGRSLLCAAEARRIMYMCGKGI
jgi:hypothetical protein